MPQPDQPAEKAQKAHSVVSHADWLKARQELLEEEKELSRRRLALAKKRQELPWERVETNYVFETTDGAKVKLSELFGENGNLIVEHFMFQGGKSGCSLCSFFLDGVNGIYEHLLPRANFVAVAIGPADELRDVGAGKGWKFPLLSSDGTTFNSDFGVSWGRDAVQKGEAVYNYDRGWEHGTEAPGISVFKKLGDGSVYHTYSVYAAGLADFNATFAFLDALPEGRDEEGKRNMWWVKHKEEYGVGDTAAEKSR